MSGGVTIKRVQRLPGDIIVVKDDSPHYESFQIDLAKSESMLSYVGRIVWVSRKY